MELASDPSGLSADGTGTSLDSDASLGLPADRSNIPGNDVIPGVGPDDVDSAVADPIGNSVLGNRSPGLSTGGDIGPQASRGGSIGSVDGNAPSAADASLGLSAGRSTSQGDRDVSGTGPNDFDGNVADPDDSALGDYTLGLSTRGNVSPMASPDGTNDSADRNDAPSTIAVDVGQAADGHGSTEVDVGGANASSSAARHPSAARLYPLFNGRTAGSGRRNGSTGELFPDGCGRISSGCLAGRLKNRGSCRARPRYLAGGGNHRGSCLARPWPPASTPGSRNR